MKKNDIVCCNSTQTQIECGAEFMCDIICFNSGKEIEGNQMSISKRNLPMQVQGHVLGKNHVWCVHDVHCTYDVTFCF